MENTETEYNPVTYKRFLSELNASFQLFKEETKKSDKDIAFSLNKTTITLRNCFEDKKQVVSDEVLTSLMKIIKMEGKIEWQNGNRNYLISIF